MRGRVRPGTLALDLLVVAAVVFLFLPLLVVFPVSVTPSSYFRFPPNGFSGRWYGDFWGDPIWLQTAWLSLRLAVAASLLATMLSLTAAVALTRLRPPGVAAFRLLFVAPLILPAVITGTALLYVMTRFGLDGTFAGLLIGHTVIALPFAFLFVETALRGYDRSLEDVAVSLGASRFEAFRRITLPVLTPALIAGAVFAFIASWDDVVIVLMLGDFSTRTLPLRMFEFMTTQIRPTIAAISSMLIVALLVATLAYLAASARISRVRRAPLEAREPDS